MNKNMSLIAVLVAAGLSVSAHADVKIASQEDMMADSYPDPDAMLEIESSFKGVLLPRVDLVSKTSPAPLANHTGGMLLYNTERDEVAELWPCLYQNNGQEWLSACGSEWLTTDGTNPNDNKDSDIYREGGIGIDEIGGEGYVVSEEFEIHSNNPTILLSDHNGLAYNTGLHMTERHYMNFGIHSDTGSVGNNLTFANYRPHTDNPGAQGGFKWWTTKPEFTDFIDMPDDASTDVMNTISISRMETAMHLNQVGDLKITGTLTQNSDERLKKDIAPIENALEKLNQIEAVTYGWKTDVENTRGREIGFKAQNVETVFPELVHTSEDSGIKSVAYGNMTPVLVKAVQELTEELAALKSENNQLKLENASIKSDLKSVKEGSSQYMLTEVEVIQLKNMLSNAKMTAN